MRRSIVCLMVAATLAGCISSTEPQSKPIALTPAKTVYLSGETVSAQLSNRSSEPIGYGACALWAERRNGANWEIAGPRNVLCTLQLFVLDANGERTLQLSLDPHWMPGEYRLQFSYTTGTTGAEQIAYSPSFSVGFSY